MSEFPPSPFNTLAGGEAVESPYLKIDEAYERAVELFAEKEIKPKRFRGIRGYSDSEIKVDSEKAQSLKEKYGQSINTSKMLANILEAVVLEGGKPEGGKLEDVNRNLWFGMQSKVIKTAPFDDYVNHIDMVVETEVANEEFSHLALGVDVTFSGDQQDKFKTIRANMDEGKLDQVKYFLSERPDPIRTDRKSMTFAGPLNNIPRVVIGSEIERVKELAFLWMNKKYKELREHPVQRLILREIALQLKTFAPYARSIGKEDLAIVIEKELKIIEGVMKEKREGGIGTIEHDKVFEEIKRNLAMFAVPGAMKG